MSTGLIASRPAASNYASPLASDPSVLPATNRLPTTRPVARSAAVPVTPRQSQVVNRAVPSRSVRSIPPVATPAVRSSYARPTPAVTATPSATTVQPRAGRMTTTAGGLRPAPAVATTPAATTVQPRTVRPRSTTLTPTTRTAPAVATSVPRRTPVVPSNNVISPRVQPRAATVTTTPTTVARRAPVVTPQPVRSAYNPTTAAVQPRTTLTPNRVAPVARAVNPAPLSRVTPAVNRTAVVNNRPRTLPSVTAGGNYLNNYAAGTTLNGVARSSVASAVEPTGLGLQAPSVATPASNYSLAPAVSRPSTYPLSSTLGSAATTLPRRAVPGTAHTGAVNHIGL